MRHHRSMRRLAMAAVAATLAVVPLSIATGTGTATGQVTQAPQVGATGTGPVLFRDFFNHRPDPAWMFYNRYSHYRFGHLLVNGGYMHGSVGRDGWALIHVGDSTWTDYQLRAMFSTRNLHGSPSDVHMGTVYVRAAEENGNHRTTMYRIDFWDQGVGDPSGDGICGGSNGAPMPHGLVWLFKVVDDQLAGNAYSCRSNTFTGTNRVRITAIGPVITVWANGRKVLTYDDPGDPIMSGGVGVGEVWEVDGWYDNVVVRGIS